ncbi:hypothetical protein [Nonomuraea sp. NPDC046570]|uniref:hypothetical protein n=1 Tax=Nonomuraea sp. NPDC046570 TaxID=3155255 RepID=UPI003404EF57
MFVRKAVGLSLIVTPVLPLVQAATGWTDAPAPQERVTLPAWGWLGGYVNMAWRGTPSAVLRGPAR